MEKCMICGRKVEAEEWEKSCINAAVLGEGFVIRGHDKCVHNVNRLVVVPNRLRVTPNSSAAEVR